MPICENCGKTHNGKYGSGRFCSSGCARGYSSKRCSGNKEIICSSCGAKLMVNKHTRNTILCENCLNTHNIVACKQSIRKITGKKCILYNTPDCDACVFNNICKYNTSISNNLLTLLKYFPNKIDKSRINDYTYISNVYIEIKDYIQTLIDSGLSCNKICKQLFGSYKSGNTIFNILECKRRDLSEAVSNAWLQGDIVAPDNICTKYKTCWHTTWDNKKVYLRSSYELDYAIELDKTHILYEVESLKIRYYDNNRKRYRCAIPDFYLPETNEIVEIKSSWTYDEQNIKDRFNAYKKLGYKTKLILDHTEIIL